MGRDPDAPLAGPSYRCFRRARRPRRAAASSRPGGRESRRRRSAACERVFFSNQKNTPSRFPRKIVRGDGVVTSSISLAAAQRAPAHSFRCSSFSHRKTLRWEPCISPLTTPLKRPKERPAGLSFGNLSEVYGGFVTGDVGTGDVGTGGRYGEGWGMGEKFCIRFVIYFLGWLWYAGGTREPCYVDRPSGGLPGLNQEAEQ